MIAARGAVRTLKIAAGVSALLVILLSMGAFVVGGAMAVVDQPHWLVACLVLPSLATASTILGNLREPSARPTAIGCYVIALLTLPIWLLITR